MLDLLTIFFEAALAASIPVLVRVSIDFFDLSDRLLKNDKNPYPLTYFIFFLVL